ncbi:hypothetical protein M427DRAFT_103423 [Gonapodya prolifera JEL478]|uniref:C2H2-type domain-containing protein n=1 Tax=Gonapodya prolifera (strain JEL478) TaxID=1344416 RepID=A0A139A1L9_GONPJ|nr:hypothetical protein M427DRAFT_103423 [Gonapodya prolifera JEL478]|eukprot:KXS10641.1 hypothetical protein M427DRAFT_103423 [Gonapodya prolifera JEL478]
MGFDKDAASVALGWLGLAAPSVVKVVGEAATWAPQDAHAAVDDDTHDKDAPRSPTEFDPIAPPSPTHSEDSVFAPSPSPSPPPSGRRGRGRPRTRPTPTPPPSTPGGGPLRLSRAHIKPPSPTTGRTYVCETCGWAFKRAHNLSNHAKTHEGGGKWACGVEGCSKTFTRPYDLDRHARVHTGAKPYQCDACGAAFARQDRYRAHVRSECAISEE